MKHRLKELRVDAGMTQQQMADAIPLHITNYNKLERGHTGQLFTYIGRIAEILNCTPLEILVDNIQVPVVGRVQAGVWTESWQWPDDEQYSIGVPALPALRGIRLSALEVRGPSMNRVYPEGTLIVIDDIWEIGGDTFTPEVGKHYVVERESPDGLREATVKTVVGDDEGRLWLRPETDQPGFEDIPLFDGEPGQTIRIIGRVRYSQRTE